MALTWLNPKRNWFTPTIHHSGSNFIREVTGLPATKIHPLAKAIKPIEGQITAHFWAEWDSACNYMPRYIEIAEAIPTVIPLRHPARIAVSHEKRQKGSAAGFLYKWYQMCRVPGFHFPIETMPFDDLEAYLGRKVKRITHPVKTIGDYPEKHDLELARKFLGKDWWAVEAALDTEIGQKYYGHDS